MNRRTFGIVGLSVSNLLLLWIIVLAMGRIENLEEHFNQLQASFDSITTKTSSWRALVYYDAQDLRNDCRLQITVTPEKPSPSHGVILPCSLIMEGGADPMNRHVISKDTAK